MQLLVLIVAMLAVARLTILMVDDRLTIRYRQWTVKRWGEESMPAYLSHCHWCTSIWIAAPIMPAAVLFPNRWVLAALSIPVASLVAGLIGKVME